MPKPKPKEESSSPLIGLVLLVLASLPLLGGLYYFRWAAGRGGGGVKRLAPAATTDRPVLKRMYVPQMEEEGNGEHRVFLTNKGLRVYELSATTNLPIIKRRPEQ